jgi:trimeric autotransporter adhesin
MNSRGLVVAFLALLALCNPLDNATAQNCSPGWVPTFGSIPGVNGGIGSFAVFDGGGGAKLYAAGMLRAADGTPLGGIAAWDGSRWSDVGGGAPNSVISALLVFDDGSGRALFACGNFGYIGGVYAPLVAKWNGTSWAGLGIGLDAYVRTLASFDDGSGPALYAGGEFGFENTTMHGIAKWNGSHWSALGGGISDGSVFALASFDDGTGPALYAGGVFASAGGVPVSNIARWNGSSWSALGSGADGGVTCFTVFDDGTGPALYAGGWFSHIDGQPAPGLAKWNGTSWSGLRNGGPSGVDTLTSFDDGSGTVLCAGGWSDDPSRRVATWSPGSGWSTLGSGVDSGFGYSVVGAIQAYDDGGGRKLYVGGEFTSAGGIGVRNIATWSAVGWSALGPSGNALSDSVDTTLVCDIGAGKRLYVGGSFTCAGTQPLHRMAAWDGARWSPLGSGMDGPVEALAKFDDGGGPALYAGGSFASAGGVPANGIAKWNGTSWTAVGTGLGSGASVNGLAVYDDGTGSALYACGFSWMGYGCVAKWDGVSWTRVETGMSGWSGAYIRALTVFDDGGGPELYAGGLFSSICGVQAEGIAKWNGTNWSPVGGGISGSYPYIAALAVFDDGAGPALYAGGCFEAAGTLTTNSIAKWDGANWSALAAGIDGQADATSVMSLVVHDDGSGRALYVGGLFFSVSGVAAINLARWGGTGWSAVDPSWSPVNTVSELCSFDDGSCAGPMLYVGWDPGLGPSSGGNFARWGCQPQCTVGFCLGDGSSSTQLACPCANNGIAGRGCENSASTGGAQLRASGDAFNDTLVLTSHGELPSALSIFLQGDAQLSSGALFGDGVRCVAGSRKRMYVKTAVGGIVRAPGAGDPPIRQQSANLGDPIAHGTRRWYQVYYRDPDANFCPGPQGGTFNVSSGIEVSW